MLGQEMWSSRPIPPSYLRVPTQLNIEKAIQFAPYGINEDGSMTPENTLCVCRALQEYLKATKDTVVRQVSCLSLSRKVTRVVLPVRSLWQADSSIPSRRRMRLLLSLPLLELKPISLDTSLHPGQI
jgi:hypothetical protein